PGKLLAAHQAARGNGSRHRHERPISARPLGGGRRALAAARPPDRSDPPSASPRRRRGRDPAAPPFRRRQEPVTSTPESARSPALVAPPHAAPAVRRDNAALEALPAGLRTGLQASRLPMLDGVRAVAAPLVVLYPCGLQRVPGGLGVLVFFVLSGFLITWRLLEEDDASGTVSLRHFYFRRALRIVPPFYVYWILLTGALVLLDKRILWGQAIASLLYVGNYYQAIGGDPHPGFSHTWNTAIDQHYYRL